MTLPSPAPDLLTVPWLFSVGCFLVIPVCYGMLSGLSQRLQERQDRAPVPSDPKSATLGSLFLLSVDTPPLVFKMKM